MTLYFTYLMTLYFTSRILFMNVYPSFVLLQYSLVALIQYTYDVVSTPVRPLYNYADVI